MDPQNEPFPVQVDRQVGGMTVREIQAINYPFFVDVRASGMDKTSPIVSKLSAVTMNWASPITVDAEKNQGRQVTVLLKSSANSWLRTTADIQPDLKKYPNVGFPVEGEKASRNLAVSVRGSFDSFFKGKPSPLGSAVKRQAHPPWGRPVRKHLALTDPGPQAGGAIETSPDTARLVVVGSAEFLTDIVFQISSSLAQDRYLNSLQFLQNAVDWSVEDLDLLGIRSRGTRPAGAGAHGRGGSAFLGSAELRPGRPRPHRHRRRRVERAAQERKAHDARAPGQTGSGKVSTEHEQTPTHPTRHSGRATHTRCRRAFSHAEPGRDRRGAVG